MKKILILVFSILLLCSCSSGSKDPQKLIEKTLQKHKNLDSYTMEGYASIKSQELLGNIPLKADIEFRLDKRETKKITDDRYYYSVSMALLSEKMKYEAWIKDGVMYVDDGSSKEQMPMSYGGLDLEDLKLSLDPETLAELIVDYSDDIDIRSKGRKYIVTITPDIKLLKEVFSAFLSDIEDVTDEDLSILNEFIKLDDIVITIDSKGYINNFETSLIIEYDDQKIEVSLNMDIIDIDKTKIPSFDPDEFD